MSLDHLSPGNFDDSTDNHMEYEFGKWKIGNKEEKLFEERGGDQGSPTKGPL